MPSPRMEELPKVTPDFKQELDQVKLNHTQTNVKDRLPSESGALSVTLILFLERVTYFNHKEATRVCLADLKDERSHYQFISGIEGFDKKQLNHLDVSAEANNLPSAEVIKAERVQHDVITGGCATK